MDQKTVSDLIIDEFYKWLPEVPEFKQLFSKPGLIEHVKKTQVTYWMEFFACDLNDEYVAYRAKIGNLHAQIKLPIYSYIAAMSFSSEWWIKNIEQKKTDNIFALLSSLNKLMQFDAAVVSAAYTEATNNLIEQQNRTLMELSTPTIQLWDRVLVLPIVGVLDSKRAQDMSDTMLEKVGRTEAKIVIMDIMGVPTVDSSVANHLFKITKATRLMGCECILSGISPEIAQTLVQLGAELGEIETTATLRDAFQLALGKLHYTIRQSTK